MQNRVTSGMIQETIEETRVRLEAHIGEYRSAVIGFSGGVDSSVVAAAAALSLGERALAVTAATETITAEDLALAETIARDHLWQHETIRYNELEIPNYAENPVNRCYFCKDALYTRLQEIASARDYATILDGANADDVGDYRPGRIAASEIGVRSPLVELSIDKTTVRRLALLYGLPNHDKPSAPCLSSRVPYGTAITGEILEKIERAERALRELGFSEIRVRHHDDVARIEILSSEFALAVEESDEIDRRLREIGYRYCSLDLRGFRSGSLNEALSSEQRIVQIELPPTASSAVTDTTRGYIEVEGARVDLDRERRCGHPEVIYCASKSSEEIVAITGALLEAHGLAFGTRCPADVASVVLSKLPGGDYDPVARTIRYGRPRPPRALPPVALISAGSSDRAVVAEAYRTLETFGFETMTFTDVGVAGIHRLLDILPAIEQCSVAIVVAGMEGALPSVVGGLIPQPVIAVPTSVGYGTALEGITPLLAMMTSCASGITVVNIDNGFGAAMGAMAILGTLERWKGGADA